MLSRRLRIVYILAANYARGGIKIQIEQANRLARLGHDVSILSAASEPDWIGLEVPWQQIESKASSMLGAELPPCDVVVFSFYEQAYTVLHAAIKGDILPVYFAQGDELLFGDPAQESDDARRRGIEAARHSVKFPYPLLTVSASAAERIEALGGKSPSVIFNGIDRDTFRPYGEKPDGPLRVLSIGAEMPRFKGIDLLYAALIKLQKEESTPPFIFVRAAPGENRFAQLPIEVEYHQAPTQQELAQLYAGADLFVGPSSNESFYLPPLEAMSCGTAVICSDLPSVREYARPGLDYLPFPPGDVAALHSRVREVLVSEQLRGMLAANGLHVAEKLAWGNIIKKLEEYLYEQIEHKKQTLKALERELRNPTVPYSIEPLDK